MAVGDIITDILAVANGTPQTFQPASGVEIIITSVNTNSSAAQFETFDGTIPGLIATGSTNVADITLRNTKIGITNDVFLRFTSTSGTSNHYFCGIQTS